MLKMIAIGNLTGDPVLKTNEETGKPYAIMRIASDRRYKSPDGEKLTDFISIKVRGVLAERCAERPVPAGHKRQYSLRPVRRRMGVILTKEGLYHA